MTAEIKKFASPLNPKDKAALLKGHVLNDRQLQSIKDWSEGGIHPTAYGWVITMDAMVIRDLLATVEFLKNKDGN